MGSASGESGRHGDIKQLQDGGISGVEECGPDQDRDPAARDREAPEASRDVDYSSEARLLAHGEVHDPHMLCKQIDQHVVFLQKELAFILETQRESIKGVMEKTWGLDLLSRLNMSRSSQTASTIHMKRKHEKVHLRLCNELFLHQMTVGGHFHLEQPQGSELIYQPEVRDIQLGTLCTTFDMCEVGKLLAPGMLLRKRGNSYLRKRTTVFTSSPLFHRAFDHRYCQRQHDHVRIEGKVLHLGKWISVSEYAARYSSGFGRNVARYLAVEVPNPSVWWDELLNAECDVDPAFVGEVMRRRAIPLEGDAASGNAVKRRRLEFKQPGRGDHGCADQDFWEDVLRRADPLVPRVGKRVFEADDLVARVQEGVIGMKVRRVGACRGTERYRLPETGVSHAEIPLRLTVVRQRDDGTVKVLGTPEEWLRLPKAKRVRKGVSASLSLTIFGQAVQGDGEAASGALSPLVDSATDLQASADDTQAPVGGPPQCIPRHGPGYMDASSVEQQQIRKLHHNLGHPDPQKFARFLRERQASGSLVRAALDFQCDSCLEAQKGHVSTRPAVIHEDIGFNSVVGMDSVTWTSKAGNQYTFLHVIDEGTLFHAAVPTGASMESLFQAFQRAWLAWAGPPGTVYVDPASSFNSEAWRSQMQSLDVRIKMTAAEAHWQLGRVEVHGGVLKKMFDKMDFERPVTSPEEFEQMLVLACNAKNSLSRVKGYSPEQAVLGISSRLPASITSCDDVGSHSLAMSSGDAAERFRKNLEYRALARRAFIDADNSSALRRALLRRTRPMRGPYEVGDWLLYWRQKGSNLRRARGQWHGPACVVAVEGQRNIWMNHSGRLVRASPEQVRPASFREWKAVERLVTDGSGRFSDLRGSLHSGAFIDLEAEPLPDHEDELAYEPSLGSSLPEPEAELARESSDFPKRSEPNAAEIPVPESDWSDEDILFGDDVSFGSGGAEGCHRVWEIDVTPPEEAFCCMVGMPDDVALTASDARKKKVEIKVSNLAADEQFLFAKAKHKEISAWLKHGTVRKVSKGKVPEDAIMRCRWILSWKTANGTEKPSDVKEGKKAKARLVVVGFEDPDIGEISSDAPTLLHSRRMAGRWSSN